MSGGCATVATDPNNLVNGASSKPVISSIPSVEMPSFNFSSMAMYPTVIGWGVLYTICALLLMFLGAYIANYTSALDWWSTFVWSSLVIQLVVLGTINGSYTTMLVNMNMCGNALNSFIKLSMSLLAAVTIIMWYIMQYDFGTNQNTKTYLLIMLHVNLLLSLLNLCLVTMQKLSGLNIQSDFVKLSRMFDPKKNGLTDSIANTRRLGDESLARTRSDLRIN